MGISSEASFFFSFSFFFNIMKGVNQVTWRGCIPVAMPVLPGNKLGGFLCVVGAVLAPCRQRRDGVKHTRTDRDLSEVSYNEPSLCTRASRFAERDPFHRAITRYNNGSD